MDELGGFFQQPLVPILFGMMCFFGLLLLGILGYIFWSRSKKAQAGVPTAGPAAMPTPAYSTEPDMGDLPDLDMLVDTSALIADKPVPRSRSGTYTLNMTDGGSAEAVEVLTVLRDVVDGKLIVQIGEKAYRGLAESGDAESKDRFIKVMRELAQIASSVSKAPAPAAAQPAQESPVPTPIVENVEPPPAPAPPKPKAPSAPPPPVTPEGGMPGDLPKFSLDDQPPAQMPPGLFRGVIGGKKSVGEPVPELNIAGAIEAYLQHKLRHTPEYSGRSIHVMPSPDGGVSIEVDGRYYDAVGDVADAEVREFIAGAIQEWQERH
jgi:hypothetical protein